jgi:hypothetical protein
MTYKRDQMQSAADKIPKPNPIMLAHRVEPALHHSLGALRIDENRWPTSWDCTPYLTFAGIIQEVMCDPETTIAIFSVTKPIAQGLLSQITNELDRTRG